MNKSALRARNYRIGTQRAPSARFSSEGSRHAPAHMNVPIPHSSILHAHSQRYHHKLALISKINNTLAEAESQPELYDILARSIFFLLPRVQLVYLHQVGPETRSISCVYAAQETNLQPVAFDPAARARPVGREVPLSALQLRRPVVINDLSRYLAEHHKRSPFSAIHSVLAAPMIRRGKVEGVLEVMSKVRRRFGPVEIDLLCLLANTTTIALEGLRLNKDLSESNNQLNHVYDAAVEGWRRALELRDRATEDHGCRVAEMTVRLATNLGYASTEMTHLRFGAQLHDIGKIGVPDSVLLKPGPLDDDDKRIMRKHPIYAFEMLSPEPNFQQLLDIPFYHHERWDGSGYPRGLSGEQIPMPARIFAVIDVWDALCSDRPYRPAWPQEKAVNYIREQSGKHFDPHIVAAFLSMVVSSSLEAIAA